MTEKIIGHTIRPCKIEEVKGLQLVDEHNNPLTIPEMVRLLQDIERIEKENEDTKMV